MPKKASGDFSGPRTIEYHDLLMVQAIVWPEALVGFCETLITILVAATQWWLGETEGAWPKRRALEFGKFRRVKWNMKLRAEGLQISDWLQNPSLKESVES